MWVLKFLSDDPARARGLRDADDQHTLADRVVSETLRLAQSEYLWRRASRDIEFRGVVIPAHWLVRVCLRELHRDPTHFENADNFDPDRFADGRCGRDVYSPFGIDQHACIGESLTRTMARIFATDIARNYEYETVPRRARGDEHRAPLGTELALAGCPHAMKLRHARWIHMSTIGSVPGRGRLRRVRPAR